MGAGWAQAPAGGAGFRERGRYIESIYSRSMLDLAILGLLEERGDLHGYEIRKQLRDGLGLLANVSFGSLYPALARLEAAGAVAAAEAVELPEPPVAPVPLTGSLSGEWAVLRSRRRAGRRTHGRRSRKVYRITKEGRALFTELLAGQGSADDVRAFGLRLAFARHLPAPARLALLERRRAQLAERLAEVGVAGQHHALDVYARAVVDHMADALQHDIGWLDRLIETERTANAPGTTLAPGPTAAVGRGAR
jgi:DNA-binding PadR family transcriptional regulator